MLRSVLLALVLFSYHSQAGIEFSLGKRILLSLIVTDDPDYTDICLENTGVKCEYCCLLVREECSLDISICDPVTDRKMPLLYDSLAILALSIFGLPVLVAICNFCVFYKFCKTYFRQNNGITTCELLVRVFCFPCCKFNKERKVTQESAGPQRNKKKKGCCPCFGGNKNNQSQRYQQV